MYELSRETQRRVRNGDARSRYDPASRHALASTPRERGRRSRVVGVGEGTLPVAALFRFFMRCVRA